MANHQLFHLTCKGIVFYKNRFLLHQEDNYKCQGALECPGGRVDVGEEIAVTLKRELKEEIGLDLDTTEHKLKLFALNQRDTASYGFDDKTAIVEIYYKIDIPDSVEFKPKAQAEVEHLIWIDKNSNLDEYPYEVASRKDVYRQAQKLLT